MINHTAPWNGPLPNLTHRFHLPFFVMAVSFPSGRSLELIQQVACGLSLLMHNRSILDVLLQTAFGNFWDDVVDPAVKWGLHDGLISLQGILIVEIKWHYLCHHPFQRWSLKWLSERIDWFRHVRSKTILKCVMVARASATAALTSELDGLGEADDSNDLRECSEHAYEVCQSVLLVNFVFKIKNRSQLACLNKCWQLTFPH